jgi:hypothetical protein
VASIDNAGTSTCSDSPSQLQPESKSSNADTIQRLDLMV